MKSKIIKRTEALLNLITSTTSVKNKEMYKASIIETVRKLEEGLTAKQSIITKNN